ncbi:MAG: Oligopeptide/dipeptide ABC transporter, ATPase subunit [Desulfonauticus sp. 38_4375]|jgi:oligopeptide/dipeptide ABC transporter ATP-binding protein|nr:MAG: Oligopeptide/dipeptide ABC transporter, ATPase subunit [Desulfonauticus sp. 38_4375]
MSLLKVKDLELLFSPYLPVLRGISLSLAQEESFGLVGESGCGKSLFALSLLGLNPPFSKVIKGEVYFKGKSLLGLREKVWSKIRGREISIILQDPLSALNPVLKVGYQVREGLLYHYKLSKKEATEKCLLGLQEVGFSEPETVFHSYPHQLSGGQRQRVLILQALLCSPQLVIADEPTTALDASLKIQILDLLERLRQKEKSSLLLISHDLKLVARCCERIGVMYLGQLVEVGSTPGLLSSPRHPYTQGLLDSIPSLTSDKELKPILGQVPDLKAIPSGCAFHPRCPEKKDICTQKEPPVFKLADQEVRCWLYE